MWCNRFEYVEKRGEENAAGEWELMPVHHWAFGAEGENRFTVERDGEQKAVLVADDRSFVYKLMKTRIKADGGAKGLFAYLKGEVETVGSIHRVDKVLNWAFDSCKPMKASILEEYPRYQVVTWCRDSGDDSKEDFDELQDAIGCTWKYSRDHDYAAVYDRVKLEAYVVFGDPEQPVFCDRVKVSEL